MGFNMQKIYGLVRKVALAGPAIATVTNGNLNQHQKIRNMIAYYTGFNIDTGTFNFQDLINGYSAFVGATAATYGIPKLASLIRSAI